MVLHLGKLRHAPSKRMRLHREASVNPSSLTSSRSFSFCARLRLSCDALAAFLLAPVRLEVPPPAPPLASFESLAAAMAAFRRSSSSSSSLSRVRLAASRAARAAPSIRLHVRPAVGACQVAYVNCYASAVTSVRFRLHYSQRPCALSIVVYIRLSPHSPRHCVLVGGVR